MSLELLLTILLILQLGIIGSVSLFLLPQTIQKASTIKRKKILKKISLDTPSQKFDSLQKVA